MLISARNLSLNQLQLYGGPAFWGAVLVLRSNPNPTTCAALVRPKAYDAKTHMVAFLHHIQYHLLIGL